MIIQAVLQNPIFLTETLQILHGQFLGFYFLMTILKLFRLLFLKLFRLL